MKRLEVRHPKIDHDLCSELECRWMLCCQRLTGELPLVVDRYVYTFFGEKIKITGVNLFDKISNAEVDIEDSSMNRKRINFDELEIYTNYDIVSLSSKISGDEIIQVGSLIADEQ